MEIEEFIERYDVIVEHLAEAAGQIPDDKTGFKPSETSLPWIYLVQHPATHWILFVKVIEGDQDHGFPKVYMENNEGDGKSAAARLWEGWETFKDYLSSRPDDFTSRAFAPPWGGPEMTVGALLDWTYEEGIHHRGQAWVYARINGIKPPAIWGTEP